MIDEGNSKDYTLIAESPREDQGECGKVPPALKGAGL